MRVDKGECIENAGRWQVRREEVSRQVTEIVSGQLDTRPSWWPEHDIRSFVMRGFLAGPESTKAPAQVRLLFGVPLDAYINPVMNKADAPQGLVGHPFLLVVDVMALAGAMTEIPEIVRGHFGHWSRLSGILLYTDMVGAGETGWRWKLVANPTATWPLPASLLDGKANLPQANGGWVAVWGRRFSTGTDRLRSRCTRRPRRQEP